MLDSCFFGANTPQGFRSEADALQSDPSIRRLVILKGGPGCGKSTLMKTLAREAERLGLRVRRIFCSSDPDSLDGVVVPETGLAVADGTAPHVLEPELCACGANYLNLGAYYHDGAALGMARTLRAEQAAYKACYGPAYACLSGAAGAERAMRLIAAPAAEAAEREAMERLRREPLPRGAGTGKVLRCYLTGLTPKGPVSFEPNAASVWALRDSFRVGAGLLRRLAERYRSAGHDLILAMDPMDPDSPAGLLVPELGTAFLRTDPLFTIGQSALLQLRLDAAAESVLPSADLERLQALNAIRAELVSEAVRWLSRAKLHHDALESLCRPLVDFDGVTGETERLVKTLLNEE